MTVREEDLGYGVYPDDPNDRYENLKERARKEKEKRRRKRNDSSDDDRWTGQVVEGFCIQRKIGSGSFGDCFSGVNRMTNLQVCLKIEDVDLVRPKLEAEYALMRQIETKNPDVELRIPKAFCLSASGHYNVLIQELLGPSLEDLFQLCSKKIDEVTVLLLAPLVIDAIEQVHRAGIIHKDIKPHNFLVGKGDTSDQIYIIDFGLSKQFRVGNKHIPFKLGRKLTGTARYVGLNIHRGYEASRRDDMESIGYMLMYLLRGRLPWQGLGSSTNKPKRNEMIHGSKESTPLSELCAGFAPSFKTYIQYCRSMGFAEDVEYSYCRQLFREDLIARHPNATAADICWRQLGIHPEASSQ